MERIERIEKEIEGLRRELTHHKLYSLLSSVDDIRLFMEKHVYAVSDFMSLLKALEFHLTCTTLPWKPAPNAKLARFINEIVLGEESDVNEEGVPKSHYEMYLEAMAEVEADTRAVSNLLQKIEHTHAIDAVLEEADLGAEEKSFLQFTFKIINTGEPHKIASAFTFGREDLIPDMFIEIIHKAEQESNAQNFPKLTYYLNRHIELDGDEHGPLSLEMVKELCGEEDDKWEEALTVAKAALTERINLWDGIARSIENKSAQTVSV